MVWYSTRNCTMSYVPAWKRTAWNSPKIKLVYHKAITIIKIIMIYMFHCPFPFGKPLNAKKVPHSHSHTSDHQMFTGQLGIVVNNHKDDDNNALLLPPFISSVFLYGCKPFRLCLGARLCRLKIWQRPCLKMPIHTIAVRLPMRLWRINYTNMVVYSRISV